MRFLIDMNLTPRWCGEFEGVGCAAVHWSELGSAKALDQEIMRRAREDGYTVFTHDLDFGALLALTHENGPSVVQVRTRLPVPEHIGVQVLSAISAHRAALERGALLTIYPAGSRVRLLPISQDG